MKLKYNTESFIERAKEVHGDKYDYSKVEYHGSETKVCIICPIHGEFLQRPHNHLKGYGCSLCAKNKHLTTEEFIEQAKKVHGDKYDYSKVEYINNSTKVCIICPTHGEFWQEPRLHLRGYKCRRCSSNKQKIFLTKDNFKNEFIKVHGDRYDYSKVEYINNSNKVCIICPIHGEFWQNPKKHVLGHGCPYCNGGIKLTKEEFLKRVHDIHGDKYDYSKVEYINNSTKVCIICKEHGEFWQTPDNHYKGKGCPYCNGGIKYTQDDFIKKAKKVHGDKYDYSKVKYENSQNKVCIICPIHGEFWQNPISHLKGNGCNKCSNNIKKTTEEFIEQAKKVHGDKYDYSKVEYGNTHSKVCIICPIHGEFLQTPNSHLNGNGCPHCKESKLEQEINKFLSDNDIVFERQKHFKWLGRQSLDFYLPKYNIAIECQGEQHFKCSKTSTFFNDEKVKKIKKLDFLKKCLCEENNLKILYYSNLGIEYPYYVYEDKEKLLEEIKKG